MNTAGWLTRFESDSTSETIAAAIGKGAGVLVSNFPCDSRCLLDFLGKIGRPLKEYTKLIPGEEEGPTTGVNVVKLRESAHATRTHHKAGELLPHSSRSWAAERPRYFALLMVEPGWRTSPPGQNGESIFVPWKASFERMRSEDPENFGEAFALLSQTPVAFKADTVQEPINEGPILYPLQDSRDELDMGVRVKQDLPMVLKRQGASPSVYNAIEWLQRSACAIAHEKLAVLERGDLVIVDNNRWAHGRCPFEIDRGPSLNPREIWSLALA